MLVIINSNLLWKNHHGQKRLFLKTSTSENSFGNKIISCNPHTSKLIASLFNGLELFPIKPDSNIFIRDNYSNQVLKQISEIVSEGKIYTQNSIDKKLKSFQNIEFIDEIHGFEKIYNIIDMVYLDFNENEKLIDMINASKLILKQHGFILLIINSESNQYQKFKKNIQNIIKLFDNSFENIQEINLSDYFKYSFMIMMTKK